MGKELKDIIEALIFISCKPVSLEKIKEVLKEFPQEEIEQALRDLLITYSSNERGIQIIQKAGGFIFTTKPKHAPWIKRLLGLEKKNKLSQAALETLSVIAYHQPVTLSEISAMRQVDSSHSLKTLLEKKLVKIVGRKKSPGKPLIYRTTENFLSYFGLNTLEDLPSLEEMEKIMEEGGEGE